MDCTQNAASYAAVCSSNRYGREAKTEAELQAELLTVTDQETRVALLDELLSRYLIDTVYVDGGLIKAIDLLQQAQQPAFAEEQYALETLQRDATEQRQAPVGDEALGRAATGHPATSAARTTRVGGYFADVDDLLTPLGSDSAITATLRADSTLRQRLEAIAHDTTWGYVAGQAALTRYLGYTFRPWYAAGGAAFGARTGPLAAPKAAAHLAAFARAYPNPAAGSVAVDYHLPDSQTSGQLLLMDQLGHLLRTVALAEHTGTVALDLSGLPLGLYFYAVQARGQLVAKGKLVKQP